MTISPRTASGAALSRASNASASPRQGAVDRAGSSGPGDYVSEGGYSVIKPGNSRRRYYVVISHLHRLDASRVSGAAVVELRSSATVLQAFLSLLL